MSGYDDATLRRWAARVRELHAAGHDVVVYFDNDAKVRAPFDALTLTELLSDIVTRPDADDAETLHGRPDVGTLGR